ncbi:voltage-gated chloride channel family protein [Vibrio sp. S11_S32]|uniref:voltage-gated chloride channel family protein n=1 Tax=Vibrio sp. S11_S32 TaxID=2720225 RepID=UPI0016818BCA|nr:voltage-gated chloride channel family protein [Vibrio sp. S11_S32]MBD1577286.1 voltage-gated chloride channel family protein [Vibrio sp. S11_S32]
MSHPLKPNPKLFIQILRWIIIIVPVASVIGALNAFFLWLLSEATATREANTWLLYLLPFAGLLIVYLYRELGKNSDGGNNLIMDEIHQPGAGIPTRMGPLVLITTVITHLFGGSAGREGTAVQIGGAASQCFAKWFKLSPSDTRLLLISGIAAGFGAIFGTPLTGAIFALEVLAIGRLKYDAIIPALFAAIIADTVCTALGTHHTHYRIDFLESFKMLDHVVKVDPLLLLKIIVAGVGFGLAGYLFGELTHSLKDFFKLTLKNPYLIVFIGGVLVILITKLIGNYDYTGLGVYSSREGGVSIVSAFHQGGAEWYSWILKLVLTALTLSVGFKGGEVTPLFFIGATLGNSLAWVLGAPPELFAALGFIAVFAAATNTPLACTIMGVELFGSEYILYFAIACYTAYYFSGHTGIYSSQRVAVPKLFDLEGEAPFDGKIGQLRETHSSLFGLLINKLKK